MVPSRHTHKHNSCSIQSREKEKQHILDILLGEIYSKESWEGESPTFVFAPTFGLFLGEISFLLILFVIKIRIDPLAFKRKR